MYKYACGPIDWFGGCESLDEFLSKRASSLGEFADVSEDLKEVVGILSELMRGMGEMPGWEGDVGEGVYVFALPDPATACMAHGFVWKQGNEGTTFVLSPKELPWLDEYRV